MCLYRFAFVQLGRRHIRRDISRERGGEQHGRGELPAAGHVQEHVSDQDRRLSVRRAELLAQIRQLDVRRGDHQPEEQERPSPARLVHQERRVVPAGRHLLLGVAQVRLLPHQVSVRHVCAEHAPPHALLRVQLDHALCAHLFHERARFLASARER